MVVTFSQAAGRIVGISVIVIVGLFLSFFVARQMGLSRTYTRLKSPLLDHLSNEPNSPLQVAVSTTGDGAWIVGPLVSARSRDVKAPPLSWTSRSDLPPPADRVADVLDSNQTDSWMPLEGFLAQIQQPLWISIVAGDRVTMGGFAELVTSQGAAERVVFCSESAHLLAHLRKRQPLWPTCVSNSELALLDMLAGFYVEPVAPLSGDVVSASQIKGLSERALLELNRRGVLVLN